MIDWIFANVATLINIGLALLYAIAFRLSVKGLVPVLAFMATIGVGYIYLSPELLHLLFMAVYLIAGLLVSTSIAKGFAASAAANLIASGYYLSSFYLANDFLYFATTMVVINLYILFTIFKGARNGEVDTMDNLVGVRLLTLSFRKAFAKTESRG